MTSKPLNNRYQILQTLGRGGFGETFLAIDTHLPSQRKCVLKQLKPLNQKLESWMQDRFQREAAVLEAVGQGQDQIPQLYAYFAEEGIFYLVQEWIEGVTLTQQQQQQGTFQVQEVEAILVSLLPVLDYVHRQNIVHRDIKPDNIILRQSDGKPVLIDFGAVKEALTTRVNSGEKGSQSIAIGTPGYMPSEQAVGRPVYSSDLYGLGMTAIFLLTGKMPQSLTTDPNTGEVLWRQEVPNLHGNLAMVIDRAIRFHPRDRFGTAAEMLEALQGQTQETSTEATISLPSPSPQTPSVSTSAATIAVASPTTQDTEQDENRQNCLGGCWKGLIAVVAIAGVSIALGFNWVQSFLEDLQSPQSPTISEPTSSTSAPSEPTSIPDPTPTPEPSEPTPTPEPPQPPSTPEPPPIPEPPQPPPIRPTPQSPRPNPPVASVPRTPIPNFPLGTSENSIQQQLGQPTAKRQGFRGETQTLRYDNVVANQVDLIYTIDNQTQGLQETEVIFSDPENLGEMKNTLDQLFGGKAPSSAHQSLEQVYQGQRDQRAIRGKGRNGFIKKKGRRISILVGRGN